jgi:hypothetical protein
MRDIFFSRRILGPALAWVACVAAPCAPAFSVRAQEAPAPAPERPLAEVLQVDPGATCLDAPRLIARVARWRERETVDARIKVSVHGDALAANRVGFTVSKEGGASAERTLADAPSDCDLLHSAVALAIALSIDATLTDANAQREAALPVPPPAAVLPPRAALLPDIEPTRPEASRRRDPMRLELAVLLGPSFRLFRDTTLLFAPRLTLAPWPWLAFSLASVFTQAGAQPVGSSKGHFDATLAAAGLDLCAGGEPAARFSVQACAGARVGALRSVGAGFTKNFQHTDLWSGFSASAQVRAWLAESVAIGAAVSVYAPFAEHVMRVDVTTAADDQTSHLPGLGIGIEVGPVFRFF